MEALHLVLLPGLHGTADLWGPLLGVIPSQVGRTVVSYPPDRCLSCDELLALIEREIPAGEGGLVVMAESFSGPLGVELARRWPGRVKALVLGASFVVPPWPAWMCQVAAIMARYLARPMVAMRGWMPDRWADTPFGRDALHAIRQVEPAVLASRLRLVGQADVRESIRRCAAPILYLQGSRDIVVWPRSLREIRRLRGDVVVRRLKCSHLVLQTRPREAWGAVESFLAGFRGGVDIEQ